MLLTDSNQSGCERAAEGIRRKVELLHVPGWTDIHGPITASIGCANLGSADSLDDVLSAADEALYLAKRGGRNKVAWRTESERVASETSKGEVRILMRSAENVSGAISECVLSPATCP